MLGMGVLAVAGASGCATTHGQLVDFLRAHEAEVSTGAYVVRPPDVIAIHAPRAPELDGTSQLVRSDGKVVLRLLGEVEVAGLTTEEISEKLKAQLSRFYVDPEIAVEVARYNSQFYYVFGEVTAPGPQRFTGRDTVLMALSRAKPTYLAWRSQIRVTRPAPNEKDSKVIIVDLDHMLRSGNTSMNILLQEGDIIEVPPTPLAWVGHRVRELLYPIEPVVRTYNAPAQILDSTTDYEEHFQDDSRNAWQERFGR
jgi:polysaccharide export outer membrane protein